MAIYFDEKQHIFLLNAQNCSYAFLLTSDNRLLHLHFGGPIDLCGAQSLLIRAGADSFSPTPEENPPFEGFSPDLSLQEYATEGCGDFRQSALQIRADYGGVSTDIRYVSHRIVAGKYPIPGQPATYSSENDCDTLEILMQDPLTGVQVTLLYGVYRNLPVITRAAHIQNAGQQSVELERVYSACLDFPRTDFDMISLWGRWASERSIERCRLRYGLQGIQSRRGASGHFANPFIALCDHHATEDFGEVYGFSLVYSSNHKTEVEVDSYGQTRVLMGINPDTFQWHLEVGESFDTPEVVLTYSDQGIGQMSRTYHKLYRHNLCRGPWKEVPRPILINNWEATYFQFDEEKLLNIARAAKELGIEMLVMDDGWFGHRNDDRSSLGDWYVNQEKLHSGLPHLVNQVKQLGLKFGIWFEPEMISPDSDLYRAHPDWCLHVEGRERTLARHQLVLDLSRADVRENLFQQMKSILSSCPIDYVKWDFNRHLTEISSALLPKERQKEVAHRYVLGLYELLERLLNEFPHLLLEGCSGGGGRFDPAMLYYSPQIWTSDDTDAIERTKIQYGTSLVYPSSSISAHVSASPNHQTGRITPLTTRGYVAMMGAFGYELDLTKVSEEDRKIMREQVQNYHRFAPIVQDGDFYRLLSPFESDFAAWMYVTPDQKQALVTLIIPRSKIRTTLFLRLRGLDPDAIYRDQHGNQYRGSVLLSAGFNFCGNFHGDGNSRMIYLEKIDS